MTLSPFSTLLFMEAAKGLNKRASKKYAMRQALLGRPLPKREWPDLRPPPGWYDNEASVIDG